MYDIPILPSCLHWWDCCWHWAVHKRPLSSLNWTHDIHWNVKTILSILSQHLFWVKYFKTIHKNVLMLLWVLTPCFLVSFSQQHIFKQNTILNSYLLWDFLKIPSQGLPLCADFRFAAVVVISKHSTVDHYFQIIYFPWRILSKYHCNIECC